MTVSLHKNNNPGKRILDEKYRLVPESVILPQDILQKIFYLSPFKNLGITSLVDKQWYEAAKEKLFIKIMILKNLSFTPENWNTLTGFKVVDVDEIKNSIKMLPDNIFEILRASSRAFPGKRIMDCHSLIYIPKNICGVPLTLHNFNQFLKNNLNFFDLNVGYKYIWDDVFKAEGDKLIESGYVLMANEILPNTRNKSRRDQLKIIKRLNTDNLVNWRIPKLLEVIVCVSAKYLLAKTISFSSDPWTFVLCEEKMRANHIVVGGFNSSGYYIVQHFSKNTEIAVAGFCKL